jgi:hypothetical protein
MTREGTGVEADPAGIALDDIGQGLIGQTAATVPALLMARKIGPVSIPGCIQRFPWRPGRAGNVTLAMTPSPSGSVLLRRIAICSPILVSAMSATSRIAFSKLG